MELRSYWESGKPTNKDINCAKCYEDECRILGRPNRKPHFDGKVQEGFPEEATWELRVK